MEGTHLSMELPEHIFLTEVGLSGVFIEFPIILRHFGVFPTGLSTEARQRHDLTPTRHA